MMLIRVLGALTLAAGLLAGYSAGAQAETAAVERVSVSDYRSGNSDSDAVEAAIAAAERGDTVYFPSGEYVLDRPFHFISGVNFVGDPKGVTLRSARPAGLVLEHTAARPLHNVTIRGLTFDNIRISLIGSPAYYSFVDITFHDCTFKNGYESDEWADPYLRLTYTQGVTVDSCELLRSAGHGGRGIIAHKTKLTVVKDSYFGTTRELEHDVPNGHFRTAINVSGYDLPQGEGSQETVIDGNVWRRTPQATEPAGCDQCQDHGLYAWGTRRLFVVGNRADGWDASAAGGGLKIRNQEDTFVVGNTLSTSGILAYVYDSAGMPNHLNRVVIRNNTINLDGSTGCQGSYCGIGFWRNFTGDGRYERGVYITENTFTAGGSIRISQANGPGFCVEGNHNASLELRSKGVRRLGCREPQRWSEPLAGLHRGDFNGDGAEDFVHYVERENRPGYWRAHLSAGDGFETADWGNDTYTSPRTIDYGVHVADFNGDGLDDLTYSGYCADQTPCWRMHLSTGKTFEAAANWGDAVYPSHETRTLGFSAGDFDGDGRADLVSRAYCANRAPCWRVHFSTGAAFDARNAGDGARWAGEDAFSSGILVGDYDGDRREDIAYLGACDPGSTPCLRVHLASSQGFRSRNWGDDTYFAGTVSEHFGLRVEDVNGDGRDDIGYVGRCGNGGDTQWRYHVSNGRGFDVRCPPTHDGQSRGGESGSASKATGSLDRRYWNGRPGRGGPSALTRTPADNALPGGIAGPSPDGPRTEH